MLAGDPVLNPAGDELGTLEHVMLDVAAGRIAFGVLARGGVLGLGAKLFAIPWSALTLDAGRNCFVLDISVEELRRAPGFDREHWPAMTDPAFERAMHAFYQPARDEARSLL
jgi:hypothetical protein